MSNWFELIGFLLIAATAISVNLYIYWDNIVSFVKKTKNKKYYKSDLYKFQRAKVKQLMLQYYADMGSIEPEIAAEEAVQEYERNAEITKLYNKYKNEKEYFYAE